MSTRDNEEGGLSTKQKVFVGTGVLVVFGLLMWAGSVLRKSDPPVPRPPPVSVVNIMPPPPPPPPPPEPPPPEEQEMVELDPDASDEPEPTDAPPPEAVTGLTGDGPPDPFGLTTAAPTGLGGARRGGTTDPRWVRFSQVVQSNITEAIRRDPRMRSVSLNLEVRIWADEGGRVTRAHIANRGMNPTAEEILEREILYGLRLASPPPDDMPMPVVMRINARRPN